jgi:hypothetical protein
MKMVVVTQEGRIVAFAHGSRHDHDYTRAPAAKEAAGLRALPGQELHEVDAPDELARIKDGDELHGHLRKLLQL